jgi:hypothetical protein
VVKRPQKTPVRRAKSKAIDSHRWCNGNRDPVDSSAFDPLADRSLGVPCRHLRKINEVTFKTRRWFESGFDDTLVGSLETHPQNVKFVDDLVPSRLKSSSVELPIDRTDYLYDIDATNLGEFVFSEQSHLHRSWLKHRFYGLNFFHFPI